MAICQFFDVFPYKCVWIRVPSHRLCMLHFLLPLPDCDEKLHYYYIRLVFGVLSQKFFHRFHHFFDRLDVFHSLSALE